MWFATRLNKAARYYGSIQIIPIDRLEWATTGWNLMEVFVTIGLGLASSLHWLSIYGLPGGGLMLWLPSELVCSQPNKDSNRSKSLKARPVARRTENER